MYRLDKILVTGFRGQKRPIELNLMPDANFLIGRNGTGKTTLINLIHAGLSGDISALRESKFDKVEFVFKTSGSSKKPKLAIYRTPRPDNRSDIVINVYESAAAQPTEYVFSRHRRRPGGIAPRPEHDIASRLSAHHLREQIGRIYRTTWLSLQRGADKLALQDDWEDEDRRPDIDRKLDDLSNSLTRYFSRLDRQVSEQNQLFQKSWFLSLLADEDKIIEPDIAKLDENSEREALSSIFNDFDVTP